MHGRREGKGKYVSKIGEMREGVWRDDRRLNWAGEEPEASLD